MKQKTTSDCMVCCFAMALDVSHEHILGLLPQRRAEHLLKRGASRDDEHDILCNAGFMYDIDYRRLNFEWEGQPPESSQGLRLSLWGRRAILTVPSLNPPARWHAVYWDGTELHDPSNKNVYAWDDVIPREVILFNEGTRKWPHHPRRQPQME